VTQEKDIQVYKILEQYNSGTITIEEAIEVFQEMETSIDKKVADRVRRTLCEYHNEEVTKNLPQTD